MIQSTKFDPNGTHIKNWCPELEHVPIKFIHQPWTMPQDLQIRIEVVINQNYPWPISSKYVSSARSYPI
jgi:deoxyribodipyrimidine photo-lyase